MDQPRIDLKSVYQLRLDSRGEPMRYRIPAYQRGYRWTRQQVVQLLEDIRDFSRRDKPHPDDFYCLQPLVLRPGAGTFEVVDGQQRLTTLLLILRHFNERLAARFQQKLYTLEYDTRVNLDEFLSSPSDDLAASNVDFFHIDQAMKAISTWFEQHESEVEEIKTNLLNRAKVIWYELAATDNPVEAFTRLNVGKIPLTNGELIRALFLRRPPQDEMGTEAKRLRLRIAYEWDLVEKSLQDARFWYFISNDEDRTGNRIGLLFELLARAEGMPSSADAYATFYHYGQMLDHSEANPEKAWSALKRMFMLLDEWFHDRRLYHLVGFLIWSGLGVNDLRRLADGCTKAEFKEKLRAQVFLRTIDSADLNTLPEDELRERIVDRVSALAYGHSSPRIRSILLLFNLATLLQSSASTIRFQFESFKTASWDIEHVRSVASDRPANRRGQGEWLAGCLGYLRSAGSASELQTEIEVFLALPGPEATDARFELLYEKLLRAFHEADTGDADHSIANLVLLDSATNRSYKNAVFAVKRQRVLALDRDGIFVPLCTRNVFLKCYSRQVDHVMFWTQEDRESYLQVLIDTLCSFFEGEWIHE